MAMFVIGTFGNIGSFIGFLTKHLQLVNLCEHLYTTSFFTNVGDPRSCLIDASEL